MDIKIPSIKIIRPQELEIIAENVIKQCLIMCFWSSFVTIPASFFGFWKIYELIKPYLEG